MPGGALPPRLEASARLCTFPWDATCVEVLDPGQEALLGFLTHHRSELSVHGFMVPLYLFQEAQARGLSGIGRMVQSPLRLPVIITDGSRTLACPHRLHCKLTGKIDFGIILYTCGHTNPSRGSRNLGHGSHLEQILAHHGSQTEPGEGIGSDQIRLSRALKFKVVSACDGKGLLCPFLGVACGKQGLGTFGWTQI